MPMILGLELKIRNSLCAGGKDIRKWWHTEAQYGWNVRFDPNILSNPIIGQIQQYRLVLNRRRGISISQSHITIKASAMNEWLKKMDSLLRKASAMAQECTIPSCDLIC